MFEVSEAVGSVEAGLVGAVQGQELSGAVEEERLI